MWMTVISLKSMFYLFQNYVFLMCVPLFQKKILIQTFELPMKALGGGCGCHCIAMYYQYWMR